MNTSILEKIRKLLALSKSDNANEAAVAAAAAQRLMTEHQIAEAELGSTAADERAQREVDPLFTTNGSTMPAWLDVLSLGICKANGVYSFIDGVRGKPRRLVLIGRPSDVASVRYLFAWLRLEIERLTKRNVAGKGRTAVASYRMGCVVGVLSAMRETTKAARQQATGAALVKLDARLDEARAMAPGNMKARALGPLRDAGAYQQGKADGRRIHTGSSLGAAGGRLLGA